MRIPKILPQFDEPALLIVTGKQSGIIYLAAAGEIRELVEINVPTPTYSDREGFFVNSGRGQTFASGSVYEAKDDQAKLEFIKNLAAQTAGFLREYSVDMIHLFSPAYVKNDILKRFSRSVKDRMGIHFAGEYLHVQPLELLRKVWARVSGGSKAIPKPEAQKILDRPNVKRRT